MNTNSLIIICSSNPTPFYGRFSSTLLQSKIDCTLEYKILLLATAESERINFLWAARKANKAKNRKKKKKNKVSAGTSFKPANKNATPDEGRNATSQPNKRRFGQLLLSFLFFVFVLPKGFFFSQRHAKFAQHKTKQIA